MPIVGRSLGLLQRSRIVGGAGDSRTSRLEVGVVHF